MEFNFIAKNRQSAISDRTSAVWCRTVFFFFGARGGSPLSLALPWVRAPDFSSFYPDFPHPPFLGTVWIRIRAFPSFSASLPCPTAVFFFFAYFIFPLLSRFRSSSLLPLNLAKNDNDLVVIIRATESNNQRKKNLPADCRYRDLTVKWSSILCFERSKIWPKVPFYRKFHFIPKNSADFRKSSIFRIFQSLHYFSCFWWISLKFRTFFDKILKFEKFHFANFESFLTESSILSKVPFYPEKPSKVLRPKSSILSWFHFTVRSLYPS